MDWQYIVCVRNVALGAYPTMGIAKQCLEMSGSVQYSRNQTPNGHYVSGTIIVEKLPEAFTIVAVKKYDGVPQSLFS